MSCENSVKISEFQNFGIFWQKRYANLMAKACNSATELQTVTMIGAAKWARNLYLSSDLAFPRWQGKIISTSKNFSLFTYNLTNFIK